MRLWTECCYIDYEANLPFEVLGRDFLGCRFHPPRRNRVSNLKRLLMNMCVDFLQLLYTLGYVLIPFTQRSLEANLATITDSTALLKAEIEKEEALLAKETKQLQEMEKNAKRSETERKRQMKKVSLILVVEALNLFPLTHLF